MEWELKWGVRNLLKVLLCRCSCCFSEWEHDCGCLKGIKLGGVHKIVLHNTNYPEGSETALWVYRHSSHSLHSLVFTVRVVWKGTILLDNMFSVSEQQWRLCCSAGVHVKSRDNHWRRWEGVPSVAYSQVCHQTAPACVFLLLYITFLPPKKGKSRYWNQTPEGQQTFSFLFNLSIITSTRPQQEDLLWAKQLSGVLHYVLPFSASIYLSESSGQESLCFTEFPQRRRRRWREEARTVWRTHSPLHTRPSKRRRKNQPEITNLALDIYPVTVLEDDFLFFKKMARHRWSY